MSDRFTQLQFKHTAALLAAGMLVMACSLPLSLPGFGESTPAAASGSGEGESRGDEEVPVVPLECPSDDERATLTFDHDITFGLENVGQFGVTVKGTYQINIIQSIATHEPEEKVGVYNFSTGPIPVVLSAIGFKDCQDGEGATNMRAIVTGTCHNGKLTLNIQEYYEAASVTMLCKNGDETEEVEIPIPVGALERPVKWSMSYVQLAAGVTLEKTVPFMGVGGSGAMKYKLTLP